MVFQLISMLRAPPVPRLSACAQKWGKCSSLRDTEVASLGQPGQQKRQRIAWPRATAQQPTALLVRQAPRDFRDYGVMLGRGEQMSVHSR